MPELKVFKNKKNNQLFVSLPRKALDIGNKDPISVEIDRIKLKFDKIKRGKFL